MKLYVEYMKEREGIDVIYNDDSFITYKILDKDTVFVYDIYIVKDKRGQGIMVKQCKDFVSKMRDINITTVYGTTVTKTNGWENSERFLLNFGFQFIGIDPEDKNIRNYYYEIGEI